MLPRLRSEISKTVASPDDTHCTMLICEPSYVDYVPSTWTAQSRRISPSPGCATWIVLPQGRLLLRNKQAEDTRYDEGTVFHPPPPHLPNVLAATRQILRWTPGSLTRPSPSSSTFLTTFSRDSLVRWREEFVARSKKARSWGGSIPSSGCAPVACLGDVDGSEVREGVDNGILCGQCIWVRSYIERMSGVVTARGAVVGCGCRR